MNTFAVPVAKNPPGAPALTVAAGRPLPYGATVVPGGVNFSVPSMGATSMTLVLLRRGEQEPFTEVRFPDASCNPYLAFAAMMMAGLDGVMNRIDPGDPLDKDIYSLSPEELKEVPHMPGSLEEALGALEKDHEFLLRGDVFTKDVISTWLEYKKDRELNQVRLRPVPYEFYLYYDI